MVCTQVFLVPHWRAEELHLIALRQPRPCNRNIGVAYKLGPIVVDGLHDLMVEDALRPFRADTALELLRDFPNADTYRLGELFDGGLHQIGVVDSPLHRHGVTGYDRPRLGRRDRRGDRGPARP
jgi:hypothetical protein